MARLDWMCRPIAHRGLHDKDRGIVENTPSAFEAAMDGGYGIECDLQCAGDGTAMVFHDDTLERLTDAGGKVAGRSTGELKKIRFKQTGDRMLTLPELLEMVGGKVPLIVEIKTDWVNRGPFEARICSDLAGYKGQAALMSFDPYSVRACA
ncbi:MAG: glycerophosphodiester phosphodiesterase family protein, partial [Hyphomicrobiales bacterium]